MRLGNYSYNYRFPKVAFLKIVNIFKNCNYNKIVTIIYYTKIVTIIYYTRQYSIIM